MKRLKTLAFGLALVMVGGGAGAQQVLKADPPAGSIYTGTSVLVDDGSCPPGKIKKITRVGPMDARGYRKSECVPYKRPRQ